MIKNLLKTTLVLIIIAIVFYRFFLYYDPSSNCLIKLQPSFLEFISGDIKKSLKIIKVSAPEDYKRFCTYVDKIYPDYSCGKVGQKCNSTGKLKKREIKIGINHKGFLGWTAATIVHNTCLLAQQQNPTITGTCEDLNDQFIKNIIAY